MNKFRRHKNKIDYNTAQYYYYYKKSYPNSGIAQKEYTRVIKTFFKIIINLIFTSMYKFYLPGIGYFYLKKRKQNHRIDNDGNLKVDAATNWPETMRLRELTGDRTKKVYYLNDHTFGYKYSIKWFKDNNNFTNKKFYSFLPIRYFKQQLNISLRTMDKPLNAYRL